MTPVIKPGMIVEETTNDSLSLPRYNSVAELIKSKRPTMPVFCFCRHNLQQQVETFKNGFPGTVTFAIKANPTPITLLNLQQCGINMFDVASPWEISLLARLLGDKITFNYNNPIKSRDELKTAYYDYGVRNFTVDDHIELAKIKQTLPNDIQISVRFKFDHGYALHDLNSKFGAYHDDAVAVLKEVAASGYKAALSFHTGTQCEDPRAFSVSIDEGKKIAEDAGITPVALNVGGGFPAHYITSKAPPLSEFFTAIREAFTRNFDNKTELICEPGRAMVATCTSILLRVKHKRENGDIFLNDGIYGSLMELSIMPLDLPVRAWRDGELMAEDESKEFTTFGPTCDSHDVLPNKIKLPSNIDEGDWIEFALVGAYGPSSLTRFNGYGSFEWVEVEEILK